MSSWALSWNEFVDWLARQYSQRASEEELALAVIGQSVQWIGTVARNKLDSKYVPGIELDMGTHRVDLPDGYHIDQHYLYLLVADPASWANAKVGDYVEFRGEIQKTDIRSPFSPIRLVANEEERSVSIMLGIRNGVRLS